MTTLFVGCSFLTNLSLSFRNSQQYHIFASPGSGNQSIAARTVYQLSQHQYDKAVILWSGINRLDVAVPTSLHRAWAPEGWTATCEVGETTWYHSGGLGCSGQNHPTPALIQKWFKQQYLGSGVNSRYLSEQSLLAIATTQAVLQQYSVDYTMSWIYNVDHGDVGSQHEASHGKLVVDTPLYRMVDWSKFCARTSPYEWCQQRNMLDPDQYHPTTEGMVNWLSEEMNCDLGQY